MIKSHEELFNKAKKYIPGGVNSPVRAFQSVGGTPIFMKRAKGAYCIDQFGNKYIDLINSWGPMLLGHSYPKVIKSVQAAIKNGTSFGTPTLLETEIAELVVQGVPNIEQIRMVNSGTEACMSAVRLARGFTEKPCIIKFEGCYHGHSDDFLVKAGSGASTFDVPSSLGVNLESTKNTLIAKYNNIDSVKNLIAEHNGNIAAIILEPVAGNMGCIPPNKYFLKELRKLCTTNKILLIFDEVMTGFRLAFGGAQEYYNVEADILCFGKIIGGGFPVGAFAGKRKIMEYLSPIGKVYQAGTLSGNPIAMTAGFTTLSILKERSDFYENLHYISSLLEEELKNVINRQSKYNVRLNRVGSMISIHFCKNAVIDFESAKKGDNDIFKSFFHHMLSAGIYLPPSPFETWFVSSALGEKEIDKIVKQTEKFFK